MLTLRLLLALPLLSSLAFAHELENSAVSAHMRDKIQDFTITSGWESRYFSEGRDALNGDGIWVNNIETSWKSFTAGVWYGDSPDQPYDELQIAIAWHHALSNDLEFYLSHTYLRLPKDGEHDHDLGVGFAYAGGPWGMEFALDVVFSARNEGAFSELSASREWELSEKLTTNAALVFGMNQGYVADGHDGANHLAISAGTAYALTESLSCLAHMTYSWGLDRDSSASEDEFLEDFFHVGMALEWSF